MTKLKIMVACTVIVFIGLVILFIVKNQDTKIDKLLACQKLTDFVIQKETGTLHSIVYSPERGHCVYGVYYLHFFDKPYATLKVIDVENGEVLWEGISYGDNEIIKTDLNNALANYQN